MCKILQAAAGLFLMTPLGLVSASTQQTQWQRGLSDPLCGTVALFGGAKKASVLVRRENMMSYHRIRPKKVVTVRGAPRVSGRNRGMLTARGPRGIQSLDMRLRGEIETSIDVLLVRQSWKAHGLDRTCQSWGSVKSVLLSLCWSAPPMKHWVRS